MFKNLAGDAKRYAEYGGWWRKLGFWVGASFRASAAAHRMRVPLLRHFLQLVAWLGRLPCHLFFHFEIQSDVQIGPGLLLLHPFSIFISRRVSIGPGCTLFHDVTLAAGNEPNTIKIEANVVIFTGARVIGDVSIGDNSEIGANCVVMRNIEANMQVMPAQSRCIPQMLFRKNDQPADGMER